MPRANCTRRGSICNWRSPRPPSIITTYCDQPERSTSKTNFLNSFQNRLIYMEQNNTQKKPRKLIFPIILGLVLVGALIFTVKEYVFLQSHEETDDAQVDGDISPVIARVSGYVTKINFVDNQHVNAGDSLVILDDRDYKIKLDQAVAAQNAAAKNVSAFGAAISEAWSNIAVQQANIEQAQVH